MDAALDLHHHCAQFPRVVEFRTYKRYVHGSGVHRSTDGSLEDWRCGAGNGLERDQGDHPVHVMADSVAGPA